MKTGVNLTVFPLKVCVCMGGGGAIGVCNQQLVGLSWEKF